MQVISLSFHMKDAWINLWKTLDTIFGCLCSSNGTKTRLYAALPMSVETAPNTSDDVNSSRYNDEKCNLLLFIVKQTSLQRAT